jgi:hypothetical protein
MGVVGKITFWSPGSGLTYTPLLYAAIKELIARQQIWVYEVAAGALRPYLNLGGEYRSDINRLIVYTGPAPVEMNILIVHECTHAIQDWLDLTNLHKEHAEADAYIAQTVAAHAQGQTKSTMDPPIGDVVDEAAKVVIDGKANAGGDSEWISAYYKVVEAVLKDPTFAYLKHAKQKKAIFRTTQEGEGSRERDLMWDIVDKLPRP